MRKINKYASAIAGVFIPLASLAGTSTGIDCEQTIDADRRAIIDELEEETIRDLQTLRSVSAEDICRMPVGSLQKALDRLSHPRPDFPGEARSFRHLQQLSENGIFSSRNWLKAREQVKQMQQMVRPAAGIDSTVWEGIGPGNIGGRIRSLAFDPDDATRIYAGAVAGGVWLSQDAGASWAPTDDFMANLSISTLVFDPTDSNIMYAGTGEGTFNSDNVRGLGIFKSSDKGASWSSLTITADNFDFYWVNRLAILSDASRLLAATHTGIWYSEDAGVTWASAHTGRTNNIDVNPNDDLKLVAGTWGEALYSLDGGLTWTAATGLDLPSGGSKRVEIAYANSNPEVVYVSVDHSSGEIYRSEDGGQTYTLAHSGSAHLGGQGWYDNALWVDPTDENHFIAGGIDLWRSTDAGVTLSKISTWWLAPISAHADHHFVIEHPDYDGVNNKQVYFANDGGVYTAADIDLATGGTGWQELNNNLAITQFYGFGVAPDGTIIGGTQDNGTLIYKGDSEGWTETFGGDGGYSAADPTDSNYLYGEYINLQIHRSTNGGVFSSYIHTSAMQTGANFIAPFILDPNNENRLLGGAENLWVSDNVKDAVPTWAATKAPPVNFPSSISAITVVPGNSDIIFVGHNNGALYKTIDGTSPSPTWTEIGAAVLPQRFLMRIAVDPLNTDIVYVAYGGYSSNNLWKSTDGGDTWDASSGFLPTAIPAAPVRTIAIHPATTNQLYVGTEVGIFTSDDAGVSWSIVNDGPANVSVDELIWDGEETLYAATHGRGVFRADLSQTTPNTIIFSSVIDAAFSTQYTTATKTISGLGVPVDMTIAGGEYSLGCTGTFSTAPVLVNNADTVCVRHISAAEYFTVVRTQLTVGSSTFNFESRTIPDVSPDAFAFESQVDTPLAGTQVSNSITVMGISFQVPIAVLNGEYSIGCGGNFIATSGDIRLGETVCVRHAGSAAHHVTTTTSLTVGDFTADFASTTLPDTTPDAFVFAPVDDVPISTMQVSENVTAIGFQVAIPIGINNGEYSIGCDAAGFTAVAGQILPDETVCVRHTSSPDYVSSVVTTLDVNGVTADFVSTTMPDRTPDNFSFGNVNNVELSTTQTSATASITGIAVDVEISIAGGEYSIGCTDMFTSDPGILMDGDDVCVRHTSSASFSAQTHTTVNIGTETETFSSSTKAAPPPPPTPPAATSGGGGGSILWLLMLLGGTLLTGRTRHETAPGRLITRRSHGHSLIPRTS